MNDVALPDHDRVVVAMTTWPPERKRELMRVLSHALADDGRPPAARMPPVERS